MKSMITSTHANIAHRYGFYGAGIGIAFLDTGIYPHDHFLIPSNRILYFYDLLSSHTTPYDDNGHGTHIAGISSSSTLGIAPKSNIVMIKVLDRFGNGTKYHFIKGLEWIHLHYKEYGIRIVNISIGTPSNKQSEEDDIIVKKVNQLWDDGLIVCIASGNNGPRNYTISSPGNSKKIITVGSSNDDTPSYGYTGYTKNYSSRGPTVSCIMKPDVVAPGTNVPSCNCYNNISMKSGTSMATPIVSGALALFLEKYPAASNKDAKLRLKYHCDQLSTPKSHQGWGQINVQKLLDLY